MARNKTGRGMLFTSIDAGLFEMAFTKGQFGETRVEITRGPEPLPVMKRGWVPQEWRRQAACRGMDPDIFFPETHQNGHPNDEAIEACERCEVRVECLEDALSDEWANRGYRGGMSESARGRERLRRKRAA